MIKRVGIIGLGTVGQAVVKSLVQYSSLINRRASLRIEIKGLCDGKSQKRRVASCYSLPFTTNPFRLINDPHIDIIVELIGGLEPARTYIVKALKNGKHVVTANKALLAEYGRGIFNLARRMKRRIGFEASVCGAIPVIKSISEGLVSCEIRRIYGILNGTTNHILYKMAKEKVDFFVALKEAQRKGFAEKNPRFDIEGIDTLHKLCILSYLCFGIWPDVRKVHTEGIADISLLDIMYAEELHYRIKLLAIAKKEGNFLDLRVHPTLISMEHPLSDIALAYNAVCLDTHPAGELLFYGEGAGGVPTSSSVISDIVNIALHEQGFIRREEMVALKNIKDIRSRYYIRFTALDKPGVLAAVSKILASLNISIASVTQKERRKKKLVPVVMITHEVQEEAMQKALTQIDKLPQIRSPSQIIRIEDL